MQSILPPRTDMQVQPLRIGSLCSGYGGLEMGVQAVMGGITAWVSDIDKGACKILAHRFPGVPNIGDMTAVDWAAIEPVDLICGGTPCQDLSHAGKRAGMTEGTRSNLWVAMREAIAVIRPKYVVWENVRGAYSAAADSEVEPCPGCVGDGPGVHLRALGRVLGDLSDLGYDASWHGLRAADVGAPHGRFRVFVVATDTRNGARHWERSRPEPRQGGAASAIADLGGRERWRPIQQPWPSVDASGDRAGSLLPSPRTSDTNGAGQHGEGGLDLRTAVSLLPTPRAGDGEKGGPNQRGSSGDFMLPSAVTHLLPTPAVNDMGEGKTVEAWDEWTAKMKVAHGNGNGHGASLSIEAQRLLPTTTSADAKASGSAGYGGNEFNTLTDATVRKPQEWGQYADAVRRWESVTSEAPPPTEPGAKGSPRLSAAFSEWMMGVPAGWVTEVPGITRNEALKACGNGVVPQQAAAALTEMLSWSGVAA